MKHAFATLLVLVAAACGSSAIDPSSYDRTCSADAECVAVPSGDPCACTCDALALGQKDVERYLADLAEQRSACDQQQLALCGACNQAPAPVCKGGTCALP